MTTGTQTTTLRLVTEHKTLVPNVPRTSRLWRSLRPEPVDEGVQEPRGENIGKDRRYRG